MLCYVTLCRTERQDYKTKGDPILISVQNEREFKVIIHIRIIIIKQLQLIKNSNHHDDNDDNNDNNDNNDNETNAKYDKYNNNTNSNNLIMKTFCDGVLERPDLLKDPKFNSNVARCENSAELIYTYMYMYMYIYIHTYTQHITYIYVNNILYIYIYIYTYVHDIYIYTHVCI